MNRLLQQELDRFAALAASAKSGTLTTNATSALLELAKSFASPQDRASILRFALRIARLTGGDSRQVECELGVLYEHAAGLTRNASEYLRLLAWASRYGIAVDLEAAERVFLEEVREITYREDLLRAIATADLRYGIDTEGGDILVCVGGRWEAVLKEDRAGGELPVFLAGNAEGELALCASGWKIAATTRVGKIGQARNDDGVMVLRDGERRVLAAIADGTGDSEAGYRASYLALRGLAEAFAFGASLSLAVECAAATVRSDNLTRRLDGVTTLVAAILSGDNVSLVALGDPVYAVVGERDDILVSPVVHEHRSALGGEPLGQTITSSGRLVENLLHADGAQIVERERVRDMILGSDGLIVGSCDWTKEAIRDVLCATSSAAEVVGQLVTRAIEAIGHGAKPDNVTALVAKRLESHIAKQ